MCSAPSYFQEFQEPQPQPGGCRAESTREPFSKRGSKASMHFTFVLCSLGSPPLAVKNQRKGPLCVCVCVKQPGAFVSLVFLLALGLEVAMPFRPRKEHAAPSGFKSGQGS